MIGGPRKTTRAPPLRAVVELPFHARALREHISVQGGYLNLAPHCSGLRAHGGSCCCGVDHTGIGRDAVVIFCRRSGTR